MPSWNIHTAHVESLLRTHDVAELGIRDANAFLFGNVLPDVYVGYMVTDVSRRLEYAETHLADPTFVPEPRYQEFWERYGWPSNSRGVVSDVVLGAWCHLMADNVYNARNNAFIRERGIGPGERTRIRKQRDFDTFGRTLDISSTFVVDAGLLAQCAAFPQYAVAERDVRAAVEVANQVVAANRRDHIDGAAAYSMLTAGFFREAFDAVESLMAESLAAYAAGTFARGGGSGVQPSGQSVRVGSRRAQGDGRAMQGGEE